MWTDGTELTERLRFDAKAVGAIVLRLFVRAIQTERVLHCRLQSHNRSKVLLSQQRTATTAATGCAQR